MWGGCWECAEPREGQECEAEGEKWASVTALSENSAVPGRSCSRTVREISLFWQAETFWETEDKFICKSIDFIELI